MHQIISVIAHQIIRVIANQIIWRGQEGGEREQDGGEAKVLHSKILISIIIGNHMKMLCLKFNQNRTVNEEFNFFEEGWERGDPDGRGPLVINFYLNYYW